jgi:hypothetical protein
LSVSASVYDTRTGEVHLLRAGGRMIRGIGMCRDFLYIVREWRGLLEWVNSI